jgi:hypothetical protein
MTELCTKYWKCENIRSVASECNSSAGNGREMKHSKFKNEEKKSLLGREEKEEKEKRKQADSIIIMQLI